MIVLKELVVNRNVLKKTVLCSNLIECRVDVGNLFSVVWSNLSNVQINEELVVGVDFCHFLRR